MATVLLDLEKSTKADKYLQLMSHAEENFSQGKPKYLFYAAAQQNREAAKIARELNQPALQSLAANKSYDRFMSIEPEKEANFKANFIYKSQYIGEGGIPIYKIYEAAALVAEENNLSNDKRLGAARKAVTTLMDDIKADQPHPSSNHGTRYISCDAVEDLSEAQRIAKRFELTDLQKELEGVKDSYIKATQRQLESLIRADYQNPI
jgi:hypothetical protein